MCYLKSIGGVLSRLLNSGVKGIALNHDGHRVLQEAKARGYRVTRSARQGAEAIVLERGYEGSVHLWSNEDVVTYGRSKNWI